MLKFAILTFSIILLKEAAGHGMLLDPPNRSSLWRFDDNYPINWNDNENFCGGIAVQWNENGGQCGTCGDNFAAEHPQPNEHTGIYGRGKIVANYTAGQVVETSALLTANHLGNFYFSLCEIEDESAPEYGNECFQPLEFADGTYAFPIKSLDSQVINTVKLPEGYTCKHCVLRWEYVGGNNWGQCDDGNFELGCGPQETFRTCSDISIV